MGKLKEPSFPTKKVVIAFVIALLFLFVLSLLFKKNLPPTDIRGHIESYPPSRIMEEPISVAVHKHILEHTPSGRRGVIINYNCVKFSCEEGLLEKLEEIALSDDRTYLIPNNEMDAKIVVSAIGNQLVLDEFDEAKIREFIQQVP